MDDQWKDGWMDGWVGGWMKNRWMDNSQGLVCCERVSSRPSDVLLCGRVNSRPANVFFVEDMTIPASTHSKENANNDRSILRSCTQLQSNAKQMECRPQELLADYKLKPLQQFGDKHLVFCVVTWIGPTKGSGCHSGSHWFRIYFAMSCSSQSLSSA